MSATRTQKAPEKAPEPEPVAPVAPEPEPVTVDLDALARDEETTKGQRVYVRAFPDAFAPAIMADGRLADVQREKRADESEGPLLLAICRKARQKGQPDSVTRQPISDIVDARDALAKVGVRL